MTWAGSDIRLFFAWNEENGAWCSLLSHRRLLELSLSSLRQTAVSDTIATVNFALEAFPFNLALNVLLTT